MRVTRVLCLFLVISFFLFSQWCEIPYAKDSFSKWKRKNISPTRDRTKKVS